MQRLGTIPVYTQPKDQRIIQWLEKQVNIHDLQQNSGLEIQSKPTSLSKKGNGTIRRALMEAVTLTFFMGALYAMLIFGLAVGLS
jgi:hypothetical protein